MGKMNELSIAEQEELMAQHVMEQVQELRLDGQAELRKRLIWLLNREIVGAYRVRSNTSYIDGLKRALEIIENPLS